MLRIFVTTAVCTFAACLAPVAMAESFLGHEVHKTSFQISGHQTVDLPMTDEGTIPAHDSGFQVEMGGPLLHSTSNGLEMRWAFTVSTPLNTSISHLEVDDVSADDAVRVVMAEAPEANHYKLPSRDVEQGFVSVRSESRLVSRERDAWIFEPGTKTFVFRVQIEAEDGTRRTLYQPVQFAPKAKAAIIEMVEKSGAH